MGDFCNEKNADNKFACVGFCVVNNLWICINWTGGSHWGIADVVESMTLEHFEKMEAIEEWENLCMPNVKEYVAIRAEASTESEIIGRLGKGASAEVLEKGAEWTKIVSGKCEGYVSNEYLKYGLEAKAKAEREAAEAKRKAELKKNYEAVRAGGNEVQLLGALIQIEAGSESYEGQLAVGAVVMNRVRSGGYPNTIADVIYAPGQFPYASTRVHEVMARGVKASCLQAAQEAINGRSNVGGFTHFKSSRSGVSGNHIVIGGHVFY